MITGYDEFVAGDSPADFPKVADLGDLLDRLRRYRRALLARCDEAKGCQIKEPVAEVASQMESVVQNLTGSLYQVNKAIPMIEKVLGNLGRYPGVLAETGKIVRQVRADREG